jgi:hypothetical protein
MTERRRVGRPSLVEGQRSEPVSTTLPPDVFAMLCRMARRRDLPVSALIRSAVLRMYHDERATILPHPSAPDCSR